MASPDKETTGTPQTPSGRSVNAAGIQDVAAAAMVSTATVSRALRGLPRVAPATRQKVLAAAANLGYVASAAASELGRSRGNQKPVLARYLKQPELPASNTTSPLRAGTGDTRRQPDPPSRGAILLVKGPPAPGNDQELDQIEERVQSEASECGFTARFISCTDAALPGAIRAAADWAVGVIIIDPGYPVCTTGYLYDALTTAPMPIVQVRLRNTTCSQNLPNGGACLGFTGLAVICGAGALGYQLAIQYLARTISGTTIRRFSRKCSGEHHQPQPFLSDRD